MNIINYLKEVKAELAHVTWPTQAEAKYLTLVVLGGSALVGLYVGGLDYTFTTVLGLILR